MPFFLLNRCWDYVRVTECCCCCMLLFRYRSSSVYGWTQLLYTVTSHHIYHRYYYVYYIVLTTCLYLILLLLLLMLSLFQVLLQFSCHSALFKYLVSLFISLTNMCSSKIYIYFVFCILSFAMSQHPPSSAKNVLIYKSFSILQNTKYRVLCQSASSI